MNKSGNNSKVEPTTSIEKNITDSSISNLEDNINSNNKNNNNNNNNKNNNNNNDDDDDDDDNNLTFVSLIMTKATARCSSMTASLGEVSLT